MSSKKSSGTVKWFDPRKGIGFILNESGQDVFVHYRDIVSDERYKRLKEGEQVEFVQVKTDKGWKAAEATLLALV